MSHSVTLFPFRLPRRPPTTVYHHIVAVRGPQTLDPKKAAESGRKHSQSGHWDGFHEIS